MPFNNVEFDKLYTLELEPSDIDEDGMMALDQYMHDHYGVCIIDMPDWSRMSKEGSIVKRISKYVHKLHNINIQQKHLSELGTLHNHHIMKGETFLVDFVREMNWNAGDYGDPQSCFWKSKKHHRLMHERAGGYCVRFHHRGEDDHTYGYARALLMDYRERTLLYNAYGMDTREIGRILASWAKVKLHRLDALVSSDKDGHKTDFFFNKAPCLLGEDLGERVINLTIPEVGKAGDCKVCNKLTDQRFHSEFACAEHWPTLQDQYERNQAAVQAREEANIRRMNELRGREMQTHQTFTAFTVDNGRFAVSYNGWIVPRDGQQQGANQANVEHAPDEPIFSHDRYNNIRLRPRRNNPDPVAGEGNRERWNAVFNLNTFFADQAPTPAPPPPPQAPTPAPPPPPQQPAFEVDLHEQLALIQRQINDLTYFYTSHRQELEEFQIDQLQYAEARLRQEQTDLRRQLGDLDQPERYGLGALQRPEAGNNPPQIRDEVQAFQPFADLEPPRVAQSISWRADGTNNPLADAQVPRPEPDPNWHPNEDEDADADDENEDQPNDF